MPFEYYPQHIPRFEYEQMREKRRQKMLDVMAVTRGMEIPNPDQKLNEIANHLSGMLGDHVSMKMMGITVTLKSITAGRKNFIWITALQGADRYVCCVWPKPMFSEGITHYSTSEIFIDRIRMTMMIVDEDQLDFT